MPNSSGGDPSGNTEPVNTQPADSARARPRQLHGVWRASLLIGGVSLGSLLTAGPMIASEWDGIGSAGGMRIEIALIIGLFMMLFAVPAFWWKRLPQALLGTFGPAVIAAVACSQKLDADYSFLLVGVPVMMGSGLIMALLMPSRPFLPGRGYCHRCGYDLRAASRAICPECGTEIDGAAQLRMPTKRWRTWLLVAFAGFVIAAVLQWSFIRFLMSLG